MTKYYYPNSLLIFNFLIHSHILHFNFVYCFFTHLLHRIRKLIGLQLHVYPYKPTLEIKLQFPFFILPILTNTSVILTTLSLQCNNDYFKWQSWCLFNPDINECINNNGGCDQFCDNFPGYYQCICFKTYTLNADNRTCEGILKQPYN